MTDPLPPGAWNVYLAAHLLNRAGFGGSPVDIRTVHSMGHEAAVEMLLKGMEDSHLFPTPEFAMEEDFPEQREQMKKPATEEEKKARRRSRKQNIEALRQWWIHRMRYTPWPLREKMTLFWHSHFATSIEKVNEPRLMYIQNETLRRGALGSFRQLVKDVSRDPAMIRWLDLNSSAKRRPNENFARELMELFTLGEGHYSEDDVQESARAFTGYRINQRSESFAFEKRLHDDADKTFMGRTGPFTGDDIIDIICSQDRCAEFITAKIWTFFAYEHPEPEVIGPFSRIFRESDYNVTALLRAMFSSSAFYGKAAYRSQVKSPVQWIIQTAKSLNTAPPPSKALEGALRQMGQILFAPPNVKGWDGNRAWISSSTLLFRYNLSAYFVNGRPPSLEGMGGKRADPVYLVMEEIAPAPLRNDPDALLNSLSFRIFSAPLPPRDRAHYLVFLEERRDRLDDKTIRDLLLLMMSTPNFQLT